MTSELQAHINAETAFLSTLHRVSSPLSVARLTEAELDKHQAERLTVSPKHRHLTTTPAGVVIGRAYTPPPAPLYREAERVQGLVLLAGKRDGEYRGPPPWIRAAEIAAAEDEHVQAMAGTPAARECDRTNEIVDGIVYALFFAVLLCLCITAWNAWLPGGGL